MHFQFEVAANRPPVSGSAAAPPDTTIDLLRQLIEVQREQVALLRSHAAAQDASGRWRAFLSRWQNDFPHLPAHCKAVLPQIERAYITLIADLTEHLRQHGRDAIDDEFSLSEFLDRYGIRLSQLGTILSLVAPLADLASAAGET